MRTHVTTLLQLYRPICPRHVTWRLLLRSRHSWRQYTCHCLRSRSTTSLNREASIHPPFIAIKHLPSFIIHAIPLLYTVPFLPSHFFLVSGFRKEDMYQFTSWLIPVLRFLATYLSPSMFIGLLFTFPPQSGILAVFTLQSVVPPLPAPIILSVWPPILTCFPQYPFVSLSFYSLV